LSFGFKPLIKIHATLLDDLLRSDGGFVEVGEVASIGGSSNTATGATKTGRGRWLLGPGSDRDLKDMPRSNGGLLDPVKYMKQRMAGVVSRNPKPESKDEEEERDEQSSEESGAEEVEGEDDDDDEEEEDEGEEEKKKTGEIERKAKEDRKKAAEEENGEDEGDEDADNDDDDDDDNDSNDNDDEEEEEVEESINNIGSRPYSGSDDDDDANNANDLNDFMTHEDDESDHSEIGHDALRAASVQPVIQQSQQISQQPQLASEAFDKAFDRAFDNAFDEAFNRDFDNAFDRAFRNAFGKAFDRAFGKAFDKAFHKAFDKSRPANMQDPAFNAQVAETAVNESDGQAALGEPQEMNQSKALDLPAEPHLSSSNIEFLPDESRSHITLLSDAVPNGVAGFKARVVAEDIFDPPASSIRPHEVNSPPQKSLGRTPTMTKHNFRIFDKPAPSLRPTEIRSPARKAIYRPTYHEDVTLKLLDGDSRSLVKEAERCESQDQLGAFESERESDADISSCFKIFHSDE
jgi:hypothetical protein